MLGNLFAPDFWRDILWALVRTALAGITPFIPGLIHDPAGTWSVAVGTVVPMLVAAVATMLKGTVDPTNATWWQILVARTLRQFGQFVAGAIVGGVILWTFDWRSMLLQAAASAATTLVLTALTLIPGEAPSYSVNYSHDDA